jgi:hypothetical protein
MKKELAIHSILITLICLLFAIEFMGKFNGNNLNIVSHQLSGIDNILFETPANVFFIKGEENKIILEGSAAALSNIKLESNEGHIKLKRHNQNRLLSTLQSFLPDGQLVNMYVYSENLEGINIFNRNECLVKNAVFNEERGLLQVDDSDIIQFTNTKTAINGIYQSCGYLNEKTPSLTNCL